MQVGGEAKFALNKFKRRWVGRPLGVGDQVAWGTAMGGRKLCKLHTHTHTPYMNWNAFRLLLESSGCYPLHLMRSMQHTWLLPTFYTNNRLKETGWPIGAPWLCGGLNLDHLNPKLSFRPLSHSAQTSCTGLLAGLVHRCSVLWGSFQNNTDKSEL